MDEGKEEKMCSFCGVLHTTDIIINESTGAAVCYNCLPHITRVRDEQMVLDTAATFRPPDTDRCD